MPQGLHLLLLVLQAQQGPRMALREAILPQELHTGGAQTQQAQLVGDCRLGASQAFGGLILAHVVGGDQAGNGGGLLHVVQVAPLEVFHQRQQRAVFGGCLH